MAQLQEKVMVDVFQQHLSRCSCLYMLYIYIYICHMYIYIYIYIYMSPKQQKIRSNKNGQSPTLASGHVGLVSVLNTCEK